MTRQLLVLLMLLVGIGLGSCTGLRNPASDGDIVRIDFEKSQVGRTPTNFTADLTAEGGRANWSVVEDPTAPAGRRVLAQLSAETTNRRYPICTFDGLQATNVQVSVLFKAVSGTVDQAAGIVVRCIDKDNYYVVRANALEDNVRLYKVEKGVRSRQFADADVRVTAEVWHTLQITARGPKFEVSFDGEKLFDATDNTFKEAGKVGVWTKADSVTYFDDLRILELK